MWHWLRWILERDIVSTPTQERDKPLTLGEIDDVLRHWAYKIHTDPDPLNRWACMNVADQWLDCRNRLRDLDDEQGPPHV